jgi:hypothetical protein
MDAVNITPPENLKEFVQHRLERHEHGSRPSGSLGARRATERGHIRIAFPPGSDGPMRPAARCVPNGDVGNDYSGGAIGQDPAPPCCPPCRATALPPQPASIGLKANAHSPKVSLSTGHPRSTVVYCSYDKLMVMQSKAQLESI